MRAAAFSVRLEINVTRSMILIVALAGAVGLTVGWLGFGPRRSSVETQTRAALAVATEAPGPPRATAGAARHEFALRPEDIANDRETAALAVDAEGRVVLAWAAQTAELERTLYLARSGDGGKTFSEPTPFRKIPIYRFTSQGKGKSGGGMTFSTHVLPRLAATGDGLYLGWVEAIDGGPKVNYYVARSADGGKTFSEPFAVHGGDAKKPGFTTLSAAPDGTLLAGWLDGRNQGQQPFFAAKAAPSDAFDRDRLVFAGPEEKGICPCCDVAATRLPDGSDLVAFRNSDSGHRDIWFARAAKGSPFSAAEALALDRWKFEGCPHDGPSLALVGERIYAAWMSAYSGTNRVYVAASTASDLSFTPHALSPGTPGAQGHPKLAAAPSGKVFAVWDESTEAAAPAPAKSSHGHGPALTGSGRTIMFAVGNGDGFGPANPVSPRPGAFQLNPAVAVGPDGATLVAWSEIDTEGKRIVVARREPEAGNR